MWRHCLCGPEGVAECGAGLAPCESRHVGPGGAGGSLALQPGRTMLLQRRATVQTDTFDKRGTALQLNQQLAARSLLPEKHLASLPVVGVWFSETRGKCARRNADGFLSGAQVLAVCPIVIVSNTVNSFSEIFGGTTCGGFLLIYFFLAIFKSVFAARLLLLLFSCSPLCRLII